MFTNHRHERGISFASLVGVTLFTLVGGLILTTVLGKNIFTGRQTHRMLIREQAYWLAESAVERALADIQSPSPSPNPQPYTIRLAPIFINPESITDNDIRVDSWPPSIQASYQYEIDSAEDFRFLMPEATELILITGHAELPYRQTRIHETVTRLGYRTPNGVWKSLPIAALP